MAQSNPFTIDMQQFANDLQKGNKNPGPAFRQSMVANPENPSVYNDEDPSNPPHQYKINSDLGNLAKRFEKYKEDNQWNKVQN